MNAHSHTPGPWVVADANGPIEGGTCVQSLHDTYMVASCAHYYPRGTVQANARLIAAAPDLLDALTALLAKVHCGTALECSLCDAARAAITKAKGARA